MCATAHTQAKERLCWEAVYEKGRRMNEKRWKKRGRKRERLADMQEAREDGKERMGERATSGAGEGWRESLGKKNKSMQCV